MPRRGLTLAVVLAVVACAAAAFACDDDTTDGEPTATAAEPAPAATQPAATPTQEAASEIRDQDLAQQPGLRDFLGSAGGEVLPDAIIYVDLTGDGTEDAVVPVSSGGEGGDIAVFAYGYVDGTLTELLKALPEDASSIDIDVEDGKLLTTEGIYGADDPLCCPSTLRHRQYRWDGTALVIESEADEAQGESKE
ncbi:MAG: hypothetical protein WEE64_00250 [Dehalococcoidia bacterium]